MKSKSKVEKRLAEVLTEFRDTATSESDKGTKFERLTKFYLIHDPIWTEQLTNVRLREEARIGPDVGIDLVAEDLASGGKVAIQCKFYDEKTYLDDLGTFVTASGKEGFVRRIVVSTSNQWTKNAEDALKNQQIPIQRILLHDMEQSLIDWGSFDLTKNYGSVPIAQKELRPHQVEALNSVMEGFKGADRGKVIMACGTGKTLTSLRIAEEFAKKNKKPTTVLFLAPSISLLSQTIMEWGQNKKAPYMALAVCSDAKVGKKDDDDMMVNDLAIPASTDVEKLLATLSHRGDKDLVVFSTYQSLEIISKAQKSKKNPLPEIDLVICDEAHRTTGVTQAAKAAVDDFSHFVRIHDNEYVKAGKRLYMTATPKIYKDVDNKVAESGGVIASMDDPGKFGEEFFRLGFGEAVEKGLLSDYRVLILAVDEEYVARTDLERFRSEDSTINLDDASKLLGCWRGLSKIKTIGEDVDDIPMKRAVAFANTIDASQVLAKRLEIVGRTANRPTEGNTGLTLQTRHVDGTQNALVRRQNLEWLKAESGIATARILTNARCLSEGIDVPALDAVIFTEARGSQVDIVQAVGRVMRKYDGKNSGYIILPVAISQGADINTTLKGTKYKVIWDVLNALRAHDDRFDVIVNQINLNQDRDSKIEVDVVTGDMEEDVSAAEEFEQGILVHLPSQIADGIYAKIVEKVGERDYWENWAKDIASIAQSQEVRLRTLLENPNSATAKEFNKFLKGIQGSINNSISRNDAIEMLAQHLITKPIFEALFADYEFAKLNPVSKTMDRILIVLEGHIETNSKLEIFYDSVRQRVQGIDNNASRQKLVTELYERFFKTAFPRTTAKLGIVYTPIEVVDFIINSVEHVLKEEFNCSLTDKGINVIDPFTGTGTFIVRLIQSGIIAKKDLQRKFKSELHANEIVLLAYYIGAINIESAYADEYGEYEPFNGIVLTDTFQMFESEDALDLEIFKENNARADIQKNWEIRVIMGNPPYSIGQTSANDDNANFSYEDLDQSIRATYVQKSTSNTVRSMYDPYIRAFKWASNRIKDEGIVCFVSNGGFIRTKSADGFRKSLLDEFTTVYVFDLKGDVRGAMRGGGKEMAAAQGGNVFGQGSTTPVAITLLVRNPKKEKARQINFFEIEKGVSTDEKLAKLVVLNSVSDVHWEQITPSKEGFWVNQGNENYSQFIALGNKASKGKQTETIFIDFSQGMVTAKDAWCYNFSKNTLEKNIQQLLANYRSLMNDFKKGNQSLNSIKQVSKNKISWSRGILNRFQKGEPIEFVADDVQLVNYRPFVKKWGYRNQKVIEVQYRTRYLFPNNEGNLALATSSIGATGFSILAINSLFDLNFLAGDAFPIYTYLSENAEEDSLFANESPRIDGISDWALKTFRNTYADPSIEKRDIFNYVYGVLISPEFVVKFGQDARQFGPRVPLVENFWSFSKIGGSLVSLHSEFETQDEYADLVVEEFSKGDLRIKKMRFGDKLKKDSIIVNDSVVISGIPDEAHLFKVNNRSPLEWFLSQFEFVVDKDTSLVSDPNEYSKSPDFVIQMIKRLTYVGIETDKLIRKLPLLKLMSDKA